jgi:hypothetical protein
LIVTGTIALAGLVTAGAALRSSANVKRSLNIQIDDAKEIAMADRVISRVEERLERRRGNT